MDAKVAFTNAYFTETVVSGGVTTVQEGDKVGFLPQVVAPWNVDVSAEYKIPLPNSDTVLFVLRNRSTANPGPFRTELSEGRINRWIGRIRPLISSTRGSVISMGKLDMSLFANNVFNSRPLIGTLSYFPVSSTYRIQNSTFRPFTVGIGANYAF